MIQPSPSKPFEWRDTGGRPFLVCCPLEEVAPHLFTTRHWPLGSRQGAPGAAAADLDSNAGSTDRAGWGAVASGLDVDERSLVRVRQVHGDGVAVARPGREVSRDADIIIADAPSLALAIRVADCVPLLLADRRTGAVAAAHAGWRGLAANVPGITVAALRREFGSRSEDVLAAAGPSIGACCYEVGPDVRAAFSRAGFTEVDLNRWFLPAPAPTPGNPSMPALAAGWHQGHWFLDGWACTRDQLTWAGLDAGQIFGADLCTASHPDAFCSYRRDGAPAGRLVGAIRGAGRHSQARQ